MNYTQCREGGVGVVRGCPWCSLLMTPLFHLDGECYWREDRDEPSGPVRFLTLLA